jgi:hypothetical protein
MASRVEYAVSMTPIRTISGSGADYDDHDVIATDIGKSLGGSASVNTAAADHTTDYGPYMKADSNGETKATTSAKMLFIKHTGKAWDSASALGSADVTTDLTVKIYISLADMNAGSPTVGGSAVTLDGPVAGIYKTIAVIAKGGAIMLPSPGDETFQLSCASDLAVEYAVID